MSDNLNNVTVISKTPPNLGGQTRVDLKQKDFDAVVWGKSYEVWIDKAIKCPCRNIPDHQPQTTCRNCGGSGWVFINRISSKTVIQSQNLDTKYKEWSEEKIGMAKMTFLNDEKITHMDRVTIINATMLTTEILHPKMWSNGKLMARTIYNIKDVEFCFKFIDGETKLQRLIEGTDFTIENGNYMVFLDSLDIENFTITLRYFHNPAYHIIDLPRSVMGSTEYSKSAGSDISSKMPLLASVRLSHYVLDENDYSNSWLLDNTDNTVVCEI